jgi:RimJ/RimL family protein N-acetyltransferase
MKISIEEADPSDAEDLINYIEQLILEPDINIPLAPGEFNLGVYEEEIILAEYAESDNSIFLIARADRQIVGALNCKGGTGKALRHTVTLGISVHREWRESGVGTALMERAVEWARNSGIVNRIELSVYTRNNTAIHLYEKFGFQMEGCRKRAVCHNGEYMDDLIMALLL